MIYVKTNGPIVAPVENIVVYGINVLDHSVLRFTIGMAWAHIAVNPIQVYGHVRFVITYAN